MHIVVTTDLSPESRRVIPVVRDLAERMHPTVTLLYIVEDEQILPGGSPHASPLPAPAPREEIADADARLREFARELTDADWLSCEVRIGWKASKGIVQFARERDADLVVMATHGRTGLRRLVVGSVTEYVVRHATFPVMCIPPGISHGKG